MTKRVDELNVTVTENVEDAVRLSAYQISWQGYGDERFSVTLPARV